MKKLFKKKTHAISVALVMMSVASEPFAQQALEEVIVSATKRAESIQDVPVSVSAVGAERMEKIGIRDMEDLSALVPNFEINSAAVVSNLYVRGLGGGLTHSIEQSVGKYVDGVYIGRAVVNTHGFMDVASVEVLRGPQGTLFGKNTVAGALITSTAKPTDSFEAGISVSTSDYSTTGGRDEITAHVSGPITDELLGRVAVRYQDKEGYLKNRLQGPDGEQRTDKGVRVRLEWLPTDVFTANLKLEYQEYEYDGSDVAEMPSITRGTIEDFQRFSSDFTPELDYNIFVDCTDTYATLPTGRVNTGSFCPGRDQDYTNGTLQLNYDADAGTITSITAYQEYSYDYRFNGVDGGIAQAFKGQRGEEYSSFSQELRFTSTADENYDYIVGLYYEDSEIERVQDSEFNFTELTGSRLYMGRSEPWVQDTESWAAFGQLRWNVSDRLTMIFGARYAEEDKDFAFERFFRDYGTNDVKIITRGPQPGGPALSVSDSRSEDKYTGSITAQWHATEDAMLYASFSQGHKTGGFSDRIDNAAADFEFDEETNGTWEIGAKTTWLDGAVAFNVAIFHMSIEDLQASAGLQDENGLQVFSVINAADSTSEGIETELAWNVNHWLTLGGNYAYTDATYDDFPGAESCPSGVTPDPNGSCNLAGQNLPFAPEDKGMVYADMFFEDAIGEWDVSIHGDFTYSSDAWSNITFRPTEVIESHTLYNSSISLISPSEKYSFALVGKNLSDEDYCAWCQDGGPAAMNAPREITFRFKARWD